MAFDKNGYPIPDVPVSNFEKTLNTPSDIATAGGTMLQTTDSNDISLAALSNEHSVNPEETFTVKGTDGSVNEVKGANLQKVLASGDYILESKAERAMREDETKYGDKNVQAATLGAARGLSFGLSDVGLKASGAYTGDELRGIENANPVASIGGEVVGAVAPALLSGGTSTIAQGAGRVLGAGLRVSEAAGAKVAASVAESVAAKVALRAEGLAAREAGLGAKALTEAAEAAASGASTLSEKGAEASVNLMAKSLEKGGYAAKQAQSIATKMLYGAAEHLAPEAANFAVQGALQGAGRLVTESTFGTADMNAENLISYAGLGALVGGTFGAAIGGGKALMPAASEFMSPITGKIKSTLGEAAESVFSREKAALNMVDMTPSSLAKATIKNPAFSADVANVVEDVIIAKNPKNSSQFSQAILDTHKEVGESLGALRKHADDIIEKSVSQGDTVVGGGVIRDGQSVSAKISRAIDDHLSTLEKGRSTAAERAHLFKVGDEFVTELAADFKDTAVTASRLQPYAENLGSAVHGKTGVGPSLATEAEASVKLLKKKILDTVRLEQREIIKEAGQISGEPLLDKLLASNKKYNVLQNLKYNSQKALAKDALGSGFNIAVDAKDAAAVIIDPLAGGLFKAGRMALNSFTVQKKLAMGALETSQRNIGQAITTGLRGLSKGTEVLAKAAEPSIVRSLVSSELAVRNEDGKKLKPRNEAEAYNNIIENANKAVTDPESVLKHSNRQTASLYEHAPDTASAIDAKYLQMLQFISTKSKKSKKSTGLFDTKKGAPSGFETAKMARYLDAITNPQSMVTKAAHGKLSREHVEVMQSIFPQMHNQLKSSVLDFISKNNKKGAKLTYQQQLQLGQLVGVQAHESTNPANVQALQSMFGEQPVAEEQGSQFSPARADNVDKADAVGGGVYDTVDGE